MVLALASFIAVAYLPGAVIFRLPLAARPRRAALPAEERAFWAVIISCAITTLVTLALAAAGAYTFRRLVGADLALAALLLAAARQALRYTPAAARPSWTAAVPAALVAAGVYLFFPSSEYVMGGKDPGTYMNEGIQIGQHGALAIHDETLAGVPDEFRDMFLTGDRAEMDEGLHQGVRFMGFFVTDRSRGEVMGQFPHGFPAWIAVGYGLDGLTGARRAVGWWALLGLVAVYFASARVVGRLPAAAGCALMAMNVAEVWYARYPNAELMQQALTFAALLALARAVIDEDRFFGPVAGVLLASLLFVRVDSLVILGAVAGGLVVALADGKRARWPLMLPAAVIAAFAAAYYLGPMRAYTAIPLGLIRGTLGTTIGALAVAAAVVVMLALRIRIPRVVAAVRQWLPLIMTAVLACAAAYAYFLRQAGGRLALHDAASLRMYAWYAGALGVAAAVAGFGLISRRSFWRDPVMLSATVALSLFYFYKIRIVPEHFWQARRFLPVVLPMTCVLAAAAALWPFEAWRRSRSSGWSVRSLAAQASLRLALPAVVLGVLAWHYIGATRAIVRHVEYAGMIPALEQLAAGFGDRDLVLIEPRNSSDAHVLATPLAYIYARHVLLFSTPTPGREAFEQFLTWATGTYERVFLVADGGLSLASPRIAVTPVRTQQFSVPEYESARNAYPREVRYKPFDLYLYRLTPSPREIPAVDIDVGGYDNAWVLRMFTRQVQEDVTYRWTRERSLISLPIQESTRAIVLRASDGGRPARAGRAEVQVFLNDHPLGTIVVTGGFADYRIAVPPEVAAEAARGRRSPLVRLMCATWVPKLVLGGNDDRALGIMLDRIRTE
jgi:hypothetical protein